MMINILIAILLIAIGYVLRLIVEKIQDIKRTDERLKQLDEEHDQMIANWKEWLE